MRIENNIKNIIQYSILIAISILTGYIYITYSATNLNSDMSSEVELGRLMAERLCLVTNKWCYSTEIRFFHINLSYAIGFLLSKHFTTVRIVAYVINTFVYMFSFFYLCKTLRMEKYFPIGAAVLMLPFSEQYFLFAIVNPTTVPPIINTFLTAALLIRCENSREIKKKKIYTILLFIIGVHSGLSGLRQTFMLYVPLFIILVWKLYRTHKVSYSSALYGIVGNIIGYGINITFLSRLFEFDRFGGLIFQEFSFERIQKIIGAIMNSIGYTPGVAFFSIELLLNCGALLLIAATGLYIYYVIENRQKIDSNELFVAELYLVSLFVIIILYAISDMEICSRYFIQITVLPIFFLMFSCEKHGWNKLASKIVIFIFALTILTMSSIVAVNKLKNETTSEIKEISKSVKELGYKAGYSTYWNANVLMEYSDGAVEMYAWEPEKPFNKELYRWLQRTEHFSDKPVGKVFVLLTIPEYEESCSAIEFNDVEVIYESEKYIVLSYDSYKDIEESTIKY